MPSPTDQSAICVQAEDLSSLRIQREHGPVLCATNDPPIRDRYPLLVLISGPRATCLMGPQPAAVVASMAYVPRCVVAYRHAVIDYRPRLEGAQLSELGNAHRLDRRRV